MSEPFLIDVTRGDRIESRHRGSLVLLDGSGAVELSAGVVDEPVFARSTLKPLQTAAMVRSGFPGPAEAIALASASHNGADVHRHLVRSVLAAAGLDETALGCPADVPWGREAMLAYVAGGGVASPVCHNCSGKHAAMVATCVASGWDPGGYLAESHPLQQAIRRHVEERCAEPIAATSVDGCGAPAHALSLTGLARGFASLARGGEPVVTAMRAHPGLVGGAGRAVTELIAEVDGLMCKDGAEGTWAAALPDGRAFAAKIADGAARALPPVMAAVLRRWDLDGDAVRRWSAVATTGGGSPVGAITASSDLRSLLGLQR